MNNFMSIVLILFVVGILFSLVYDQNLPEKDKVKIPENCAIWFDGCNTCHDDWSDSVFSGIDNGFF